MYSRAEENNEESPDPSEEALFTTSCSLTANTEIPGANPVNQSHEIQEGGATYTKASPSYRCHDGGR